MQSILLKTKPSLPSQCSWMFPKSTQILGRRHRCREKSWISSRGGQSIQSVWVRRFSSDKANSTGSTHRGTFFSFFEWYSKKLDSHPMTTKCISAGLISSIGSVLAQMIDHRQEQQHKANDNNSKNLSRQQPFEVDLAQVSRFAFLNVVFVAPVLHHWYNMINRAIPGTSFPRVLQRTFVDEFLFSPIYIPSFLGILWKLEGTTNEDIWKMLKSECPSIIVAEWVSNVQSYFLPFNFVLVLPFPHTFHLRIQLLFKAMWVPTMIFTFRYVPVKFQVMVVNVVGVVWQTFLAYAANNAHSTPSEVENNGNKQKVLD